MARDSLDRGRALGRSPVHLRVTRFEALVFLRWLREAHQVTTANLWHVKELLGHEHLDTLQHYAKLTIADIKKTHAKCHPRGRKS
jgi:hypothetical protein